MSDIEKNEMRRNSDFLLQRTLDSKREELSKYKLKLYEPKNVVLDENLKIQHRLNMENQILNFFIVIFSIFIVFQLTVIILAYSRLDDYFVEAFSYVYYISLILGKMLNIVFLINFLIRCYIGIQLNTDSMILFKLINIQFNGFIYHITIVLLLLGINFGLKQLLDINTEVESLEYFKSLIDYTDLPLLITVVAGTILCGIRELVKLIK